MVTTTEVPGLELLELRILLIVKGRALRLALQTAKNLYGILVLSKNDGLLAAPIPD